VCYSLRRHSVASVVVDAHLTSRRGARAVEWDSLENCCRCKPTVGSNPTPSAKRNPSHTRRILLAHHQVLKLEEFRNTVPHGVFSTLENRVLDGVPKKETLEHSRDFE
jgi:hypothetical protein